MAKNNKFFYCPSCELYPDAFKEVSVGPMVTWLKWNGSEYDVEYSNVDNDDLEFQNICGVCEYAELEVRER